jgi:hypothetical protein
MSDPFNFSQSGHDLIIKSVQFIKVLYINEAQFLPQEQYGGYKARVQEISKNLKARVVTFSKFHTENSPIRCKI